MEDPGHDVELHGRLAAFQLADHSGSQISGERQILDRHALPPTLGAQDRTEALRVIQDVKQIFPHGMILGALAR